MIALSYSIERSTGRVVSYASDTVSVYANLRKGARYISSGYRSLISGAQYFISIVDAIFGLAILLALVPFLAAVLMVFTVMLLYVNIVLWGNIATLQKWIGIMSREDAIHHHLKIERALRDLKRTARSNLISKTPVVGYLFRKVLKKTILIEQALERKAYPSLFETPNNITVHPQNSHDSWQQEPDDADVYQDYYLNK